MYKKMIAAALAGIMVLFAAAFSIASTETVGTVKLAEPTATKTVSITPIHQGTYDCEATALAMLLQHYDSSISYSEVTNASSAYSGWSYNQYGQMLYITIPNVISLANSRLSAHNSSLTTVNLSGSTVDQLCARLDAGHPTFVIYSTNTSTFQAPTLATVDNGYNVYEDTHAVVLCGYNTSNNQLQIADPATGSLYWISRSAFTSIWNAHNNYAMGINYPKTNVTVKKVWADDNNRDGKRLSTTAFASYLRLYANGTVVSATPTVTASGNTYTITYSNLDKMDANGNITYKVGEATVPAGYTASATQVNAGGTITNTHTSATATMPVTATWSDDDNRDGKRPESLTVWMTIDGVRSDNKVVLNEANNWTANFPTVNVYRDGGVPIEYSVDMTTPAGYSMHASGGTANGFAIQFSREVSKTNISVTKNWVNDIESERPSSVTFALKANGAATSKTLSLTAADGWQGSFDDLFVNENGSAITYTVEETVPSGYTSEMSGSQSAGFVFTNTKIVDKTSVSFSLIWDDDNNRDGYRPDSVTVWLVADGQRTSKKVTLSDGNWSGSFDDLDATGSNGAIAYTVEATAPSKYSANTTGSQEQGYSITCVHEPEKLIPTYEIIWDYNNDADGLRPSTLDLILKAGGEPTSFTCTATAASGWTGSGPEQYSHQGGALIPYLFSTSHAPAGYRLRNATADGKHTTITCTHETSTISIPVSATWSDDDNRDGLRPSTQNVVLVADGTPTSKTLTLSAAENWSGSFDGIAANNSGSAISYTVQPATVAGYTTNVSGNVQNGFVIENAHETGTVSVAVALDWDDDDDRDGLRPASVGVSLLANGSATSKSVTLNSAGNWSGSFDGLDANESGNAIAYTVSAAAPTEYTANVTGNASTGYTVKLSHTPATTSVPVSITWNDDDDSDGLRPSSVEVFLVWLF